MEEISFRERVKKVAIQEARKYKEVYIDYEHLIFASCFEKKYYIITGTELNYLHLIGVHTSLSKETFFDRCLSGKLDIDDFDFDDDGKDVKGTVRRKIKVLPNMNNLMFQPHLYVKEKFIKNRVVCSLGTSDNICTVGFIKTGKKIYAKAFPKSLMKGNELKDAEEVELLLRRKKGKDKFDKLLIGNGEMIRCHFDDLKDIVAVNLYANTRSRKKKGANNIMRMIKVPKCFRTDIYSEKLKQKKMKKADY